METVRGLLILIGFVTVATFIGILIGIIIMQLISIIQGKIYIKKRKNRFNKVPTAACYCRDCVNRSLLGYCEILSNGKYTANEWFCSFATPRIKDPEKEVQ